jgi:hypothetical protein
MNSALQDKLDDIWAILAPVYDPDDDMGAEDSGGLVHIDVPIKRPPS